MDISIDELRGKVMREDPLAYLEYNYEKELFGKNLFRLLNQKGFTKEDLASYLGYSVGVVDVFLLGYNMPQPNTIKKIAEFLEVEETDLWMDDFKNGMTTR